LQVDTPATRDVSTTRQKRATTRLRCSPRNTTRLTAERVAHPWSSPGENQLMPSGLCFT
jgi:hypothetical protein